MSLQWCWTGTHDEEVKELPRSLDHCCRGVESWQWSIAPESRPLSGSPANSGAFAATRVRAVERAGAGGAVCLSVPSGHHWPSATFPSSTADIEPSGTICAIWASLGSRNKVSHEEGRLREKQGIRDSGKESRDGGGVIGVRFSESRSWLHRSSSAKCKCGRIARRLPNVGAPHCLPCGLHRPSRPVGF